MMFSNQRDSTIGLLVLRHLYQGHTIDYPAPDSLPQASILRTLEQNGYIERWDRIWPLSDRYRLTPKGAQAIQSVYRPDNAAAIMAQLQGRHLAPEARPQALRAMGLDPALWPILHDPAAHWMTWPGQIGPYQYYIWEPPRPQPAPAGKPRPGDKPAQRRAQGAARPAPGPPAGTPRHHDSTYHDSYVDPAYYYASPSYDHHHYGSSGSSHEPQDFQGGGGESGGGGASGGYETDDLDTSGDAGGGSDYGDVS